MDKNKILIFSLIFSVGIIGVYFFLNSYQSTPTVTTPSPTTRAPTTLVPITPVPITTAPIFNIIPNVRLGSGNHWNLPYTISSPNTTIDECKNTCAQDIKCNGFMHIYANKSVNLLNDKSLAGELCAYTNDSANIRGYLGNQDQADMYIKVLPVPSITTAPDAIIKNQLSQIQENIKEFNNINTRFRFK